jgi:signal transduction histidine kinase
MATLAPPRDTAPRPVPWSPRAWRQAWYLAVGVPVQLLALAIVLIPSWSLSIPSWHHLSGERNWGRLTPLLLLCLVIVFLAVPALTGLERRRVRATAGVDIPPQPAVEPRWTRTGLVSYVRSPATWRQLGYHLLVAPVMAAGAIAAAVLWLAGLLCTLVYAYAWTRPSGSLLARGQSSPLDHLHRTLPLPGDVWLTLGGLVLLVAAPRLTAAVAALDAQAARALLGPSRAQELEYRVEHLTQSRTGAVDAADAERRRLERDLHDGTQQRLVALAMNLGLARVQAQTAEQAQQALAEAHDEAKAALAELRNLVRGLHPAVLEDRGLDAALSGITARMPIPVRLTVDLPRRPSPTIEAVAYFVVSEGLTNITKHAQASQAEVVVQRAGDRLHIIVSDDGVGGADPARGTGLAGLAQRAASVDGSFEIASLPGGPTLITVDLPWVR